MGADMRSSKLLPGTDEATMLSEIDTYAQHFTNVYSAVWRDIAVRRRRTQIETLIGPVIDEGARLGQSMPLNRAMKQLLAENLDDFIAISER
jgi:2-dehydropantoate 2-reductase